MKSDSTGSGILHPGCKQRDVNTRSLKVKHPVAHFLSGRRRRDTMTGNRHVTFQPGTNQSSSNFLHKEEKHRKFPHENARPGRRQDGGNAAKTCQPQVEKLGHMLSRVREAAASRPKLPMRHFLSLEREGNFLPLLCLQAASCSATCRLSHNR